MYNRLLFSVLCFNLITSIGWAQKNSENIEIYNWLDTQIGQVNTGIFNGSQYAEEHRMINEKHKFFKSFKFIKGTLFYDGFPYPDVLMRYNIYENQIIVKGTFSPSDPDVVIDNSKLSRFILAGHEFENHEFILENEEEFSGFLEVLLQTDGIAVYKKHQKEIRTRTSDQLRYHEFDDDSQYIVHHDGTYKLIKNPKKLSKQFPEYKIFIRDEVSNRDKESINWDSVIINVFSTVSKNREKAKI